MDEKKSEFEKLSKDLTKSEREEMLKKIKKSKGEADGLDENDLDGRFYDPDKKEPRQFKLARSIYEKENFLGRIIIRIIAFFKGIKKEEVILDRLFVELKKEISGKYNYIVNFDDSTLTNNFIIELLKLAEVCNDAVPIIEMFFGDHLYYNSFVCYLVEKNFSDDLKKKLDSLKPEHFSAESEVVEKEKFLEEKKERLKDFFRELSHSKFLDQNAVFKRFEIFIKLVTYDYKTLLYYFTSDYAASNDVEKTGVKFFMVDELLEKLSVILNVFNFDYNSVNYVEEMKSYSKNFPISEKDTTVFFTDDEIKVIQKVFNTAAGFKEKIPLLEIYQYFRKDLLYRIPKLEVSFNMINNYKEYMRNKVNSLWEEYYLKIKIQNQLKLIKELFKDYDFNTLDYFTLDFKNKVDAHSHVKLKNIKKMNTLTNFMEKVYKPEIEKIINKILIDGNFNNESYRNNLSSGYYILYKSIDRLREFDRKFQSESEIGRKITTFLKLSTGEVDYVQTLQNTILDVNQSSDSLIEEVYNTLGIIYSYTSRFVNYMQHDSIVLLNFDMIKIPGYVTSQQALLKVNKNFDLFFKVFTYLDDY
jgi:hypothetical protein